jgi:hypothetical protein
MAVALTQTKHARLSREDLREKRVASDASGFKVELGFAVLTILGTFAGAARPLQLLFTPLSAIVAFYLLRSSRARYVRFTILLWFFAPVIRRLADYHAGFQDPSPMLLAPMLASCLAVFYLPSLSIFLTRQCIPFSLVLLSLLYSWIVGAVQCGFRAATVDFVRWLPPIIFALYCARVDDEHEDIAATVKRCFVFGLIVMGLYALVQNSSVPPWDYYWLENVNGSSFGSVGKETVRVWGTMNSPGPFAATLAAGILLLMGAKQKFAFVAQLLGAVALVLTEVRSAWLGLIAGLVVILFSASKPTRLRMALLAGIAAVSVAGMLAYSSTDTDLSKRFSTLFSVKQDESVNERLAGAERAIPHALENPFGGGMGYLDTRFEANLDAGGTDFGAHDNGIYEFLVTLGVLGTLVYLGSTAAVLFRAQSKHLDVDRDWRAGCLAVCASYLVQLPTGNTMTNVDGIVFWLAAGFLMRQSRTREQAETTALPATS